MKTRLQSESWLIFVAVLMIGMASASPAIGQTDFYWTGTWGEQVAWQGYFRGTVDQTSDPSIVALGDSVTFSAVTAGTPGNLTTVEIDYCVFPWDIVGYLFGSMVPSAHSADVTEDYPVTISAEWWAEDFGHSGQAEVTFTASGGEGWGSIPPNAYEDYPDAAPVAVHFSYSSAVPEPSTLVLLAIAAVGLFAWRRRRQAV